MTVASWVAHWGTTAAERASAFGCDELIGSFDSGARVTGPPTDPIIVFRGIDVAAPPPVAFRWLCQLRAAPYSYDLIDNLGRRSPRTLTPGLEHLEVGQRILLIYRIAAFEPGRSITMANRPGRLGHSACTYRVDPLAPGRCRIVVKMLVVPPAGLIGALMRRLFAPGDLIMMHRQLRTLATLAQRSA